jgi:hypothetical protein
MCSSTKLPAAVLGLTLLSCIASHAAAHPFQIDQASEGNPFGGFAIDATTGNVIGQEFTPTFSALDVVEIGLGPHSPDDFGVRVNIRAGTIDGPILGTSLLGVLPGPPPTPPFVHFDFAAPVPLVPGNLYVIQPILAPGSAAVGLPFLDTPPYAGGRALVFGQVREDIDLLFREGLTVPEPASCILIGVSCALAEMRLRRRRSLCG